MVLGTHLFDMMRFLVGDPRWCFGKVWQDGKLAVAGDARAGGEGMGPVLGDRLTATYGFDGGVTGTFGSHKARHGVNSRFGLTLYGSKGVIALEMGWLPPTFLLDDPSWNPGKSGAKWQPVTSAGVGKDEPLKDGGLAAGNLAIANDLLDAIAADRQPVSSIYDGRASLEMILAVYESHLKDRPVELPLKNRRHPLGAV
jgi:predicted dehydrogenase